MTDPDRADRPLPDPDDSSAPYWAAAARGALVLARCQVCERLSLPPDLVCPHCDTTEPDWAWDEVSGRGTIRAWTVSRRGFVPGVPLPFVLVDVEVVEQPDLRLLGRLIDGPDAPVAVGAAVRTEFERIGLDLALPVFALEAR